MRKAQEFIDYVLGGGAPGARSFRSGCSALAGDVDDFDDVMPDLEVGPDPSDFARGLLERCFGDAPEVPVSDILIAKDDAEQRRLNEEYAPGAHYWPPGDGRKFRVVLLRLRAAGTSLASSAPRRAIRELQLVEDELHRRLQDGLVWFERGGPRRTPTMPQGSQTETLLVVAVSDDRPNTAPRQLLCFGTKSEDTGHLQSFFLREEVRDWAERGDRPLAVEHLGQVYQRHFAPLASVEWQSAFITGDERDSVGALLKVCRQTSLLGTNITDLQTVLVRVLDVVAGSFGVARRAGKAGERLKMTELPPNHGIGVDPAAAARPGFVNPLQGFRIYDRDERLLGFVVYIASSKGNAEALQQALAAHNHYHNVLVIYPDSAEPQVELWQGGAPLTGRFTQGPRRGRFDGEEGVVQLISRFFVVSRSSIEQPKQLAVELGDLRRPGRLVRNPLG